LYSWHHRLPLGLNRSPPLVRHVGRQNSLGQTQVIQRQPPALLSFARSDEGEHVLIARFVQVATCVGPIVVSKLENRLPREAIGKVFGDFLFRNCQTLDSECKKAFASKWSTSATSGLRLRIAVLGILHAGQLFPGGTI